MNRFIESKSLLKEINNYISINCNDIKDLYDENSFIDSKNIEFINMINLFEIIVKKLYNYDSLIISIGESPSKMIDIQSKMNIWNKKRCKCFYLPISKTILHIDDLQKFYFDMENYQDTNIDINWKLYFNKIIQKNLESIHVKKYKSFLNNRDILNEFINLMNKNNEIFFVDFLIYGNSFIAFFLCLFIPLLKLLNLDLNKYKFYSVFLISSDNTHHKICDPLSILLDTFFINHYEIYIDDYFELNGQIISDFFMDFPDRIIQQVNAPNYSFPTKIPKKHQYIKILLLIYIMIFLNKKLYKKFNF